MKKLKRLLITCLIISIFMSSFCPTVYGIQNFNVGGATSGDGLSPEQQAFLVQYVRVYDQGAKENKGLVYASGVNNGQKHIKQNEIDINKLGESGTYKGKSYTNKIPTCCTVFIAAMFYQALGIDTPKGNRSGWRGAQNYANPACSSNFRALGDEEEMQPGDVITYSNASTGEYCVHVMLYLGYNQETGCHEIADTCAGDHTIGIHSMTGSFAKNSSSITPGMIRRAGIIRECTTSNGQKVKCNFYGHVSRLTIANSAAWVKPDHITIQWPNGMTTEFNGDIGEVSTTSGTTGYMNLYYEGIAPTIGTLGSENMIKTWVRRIINGLDDILNYVIGIITSIIRIPLVGFANLTEELVASALRVIADEPGDDRMTFEKIVLNQVPLFDVNIFDFNEAGGRQLEEDNIILVLRRNVAGWYYAFRNLVIVALLAILIYLGVRMAITSIAEEKAQYKRMLVDWFVSFFIVLFIHYFILIILRLNDWFVGLFTARLASSDVTSIYTSAYDLARSAKFSEGWVGTILYIGLVWYMVKYTWKYAKRMLTTYILIILSPLVSISYAIDKIKDNRSQSLSKWLKEIAFTILIQSVHALIYVVFGAGIISQIAANSTSFLETVGMCVFALIAIKFMDTAENMFETIFGFKNSDMLKEVMDSTFELFAKYTIVKDVLKGYFKVGGKVVKFGWKAGKTVIGKPIKYGSNKLEGHWTGYGNFMENARERVQKIKEAYEGKEIKETRITGISKMRQKYRDGKDTKRYDNKKLWNSVSGSVKGFGKAVSLIYQDGKTIAGITSFVTAMKALKYARKQVAVELRNPNGKKRTIKGPKKIDGQEGAEKLQKMAYKGSAESGSVLKRIRESNKIDDMLERVTDKDDEVANGIEDVRNNTHTIFHKIKTGNATDDDIKFAEDVSGLVKHNIREATKMVYMKDTDGALASASLDVGKSAARTNNMTITDIYAAVKTTGVRTNVTEVGFKKRFNIELETKLTKQALSGDKRGARLLAGKFGQDISDAATVAREDATSHNLSKKEIDKAVHEAIKQKIHEGLQSEETQKEILSNLTSSEVASMAIKSANIKVQSNNSDVKKEIRNAIDSVRQPNNTKDLIEGTVAHIEQAREMKIDRKAFVGNMRQELENAMMRKVTGGVESIEITFGEKVGELYEKKLAEVSGSKREERAARAAIHEFLGEDKNLYDTVQELGQDDQSNLITRALNADGSIERNIIWSSSMVQDVSNRDDSKPKSYKHIPKGIAKRKEADEELAHFDALTTQAINLRKSYSEAIARLDRRDSVEDIAKAILKRSQSQENGFM